MPLAHTLYNHDGLLCDRLKTIRMFGGKLNGEFVYMLTK
jgi:hypothetical protein